MSASIHVGDVGTELRADTRSDLTGANSVALLVEKPDGTQATWVGINLDNRYVQYFTVDGDWSVEGEYCIHAFAEFATGSQFHGNVAKLMVRKLYCQ